MNLTFAATETRTALLVENMGKINVLPRVPSAASSAALHQVLLSYVMDRSRYRRARKRAIKNISVMGTGIVGFGFNADSGDIEAHAIDTRQFFVQPGCLDVEAASFCGTMQHIPLTAALERWPSLSGKVQPGTFVSVEALEPERAREASGSGIRIFTVVGVSGVGVHTGAGTGARFDIKETERVTHLRLFRRERLSAEDMKLIPAAAVRPSGYGWVLYEVVNNVLVHRSPWPLRRVPFAVFRAYDDTWAFYAPASIDFCRGLQKSVDLRLAYLLDWLDSVVKPTVVYDEQGGLSWEYNEASKLREIKYRGGPGVAPPRLDRPPDTPQALFTIIQMEWEAFDRQMGNLEILQGQRPIGVQTGEGLKVLTENANARVRSESRSVSEGDYQAAWIMLEMGRHYLGGAMLRYGHEFMPEDMGSFASGLPRGFAQIPPDSSVPSLDELDVQLDFSYLSPEDRRGRGQLALELFRLGVYDVDDLLEALDEPNRKRIAAKYRERQNAARAAMQASGAAAGAQQGSVVAPDQVDMSELEAMGFGAQAGDMLDSEVS